MLQGLYETTGDAAEEYMLIPLVEHIGVRVMAPTGRFRSQGIDSTIYFPGRL